MTDSPAVRDLIEQFHVAFNEPNDLLTNPRFAPARAEIVAKALKHDRRDLPSDVIDWFIWSLITTIGTPLTLRHYLPAIVEDLMRTPDKDNWWMFIGKMEMAGFSEWPRGQRRLVCAAIRLWLSYYIMREERVTGRDIPELAPEAVITTTPALKFFPPITMTPGEADFVVEALHAAMHDVGQSNAPQNT